MKPLTTDSFESFKIDPRKEYDLELYINEKILKINIDSEEIGKAYIDELKELSRAELNKKLNLDILDWRKAQITVDNQFFCLCPLDLFNPSDSEGLLSFNQDSDYDQVHKVELEELGISYIFGMRSFLIEKLYSALYPKIPSIQHFGAILIQEYYDKYIDWEYLYDINLHIEITEEDLKSGHFYISVFKQRDSKNNIFRGNDCSLKSTDRSLNNIAKKSELIFHNRFVFDGEQDIGYYFNVVKETLRINSSQAKISFSSQSNILEEAELIFSQ